MEGWAPARFKLKLRTLRSVEMPVRTSYRPRGVVLGVQERKHHLATVRVGLISTVSYVL